MAAGIVVVGGGGRLDLLLRVRSAPAGTGIAGFSQPASCGWDGGRPRLRRARAPRRYLMDSRRRLSDAEREQRTRADRQPTRSRSPVRSSQRFRRPESPRPDCCPRSQRACPSAGIGAESFRFATDQHSGPRLGRAPAARPAQEPAHRRRTHSARPSRHQRGCKHSGLARTRVPRGAANTSAAR